MTPEAVGHLLQQYTDELDRQLCDQVSAITGEKALIEPALEAIAASGLKGRGFLTRSAAGLLELEVSTVRPIELASELLMVSAYVIDDYLDHARTRGGVQATWSKYDLNRALVVAQLLHCLAAILLSEMPDGSTVASQFHRIYARMYEAEFGDITLAAPPSVDESMDLAFQKTGALVAACVTAPALLSKKKRPALTALETYGKAIGLAIQMRNDLVDVIGEEELTGKPVLGDLWHGRANVVLAYAFARTGTPEKEVLQSLWGRGASAEDRVPEVLEALMSSGALEHATHGLKLQVKKAHEAISTFDQSEAQGSLAAFAEMIGNVPVGF